MICEDDTVSQRLLRKGALVEETYILFSNWDFDCTFESNFDQICDGRFRTQAWGTEVKTTIRRRFRDIEAAAPLIVAAKKGLPLEEWRHCLLLWIGSRERLYHEFAVSWLFPEFESGRYQIGSEDVQPFVRTMWRRVSGDGSPLSEYGVIRTARDLLRMANDFGLLHGDGPQRTFAPLHLSDRCLLYYAHAIAEAEKSTSRVPASNLWRLALLRPGEVIETLLRLHQFRKLHYEVAGSLVQLTLPSASSREYAERMGA